MNIGHGMDRGAQCPVMFTFPCEVLYFSSAKRLPFGPTTIMLPGGYLAKCSGTIEKVVRNSGTFSAIDGPAKLFMCHRSAPTAIALVIRRARSITVRQARQVVTNHLLVVLKAPASQDHGSAGRDVARFAVP